MNDVVLSVGSNCPDKRRQVGNCIGWLKRILGGMTASCAYATRAVNGKDPDYLNAVVKGGYAGGYEELRKALKKYEADCGRTPDSKSAGNIPIDIDIVIWNGRVLKDADFRQGYFQTGWAEIAGGSMNEVADK